MYGKVQSIPQNEKTNFYPLSPYGVAKLYAYWITKNYREAYKIFACNGIFLIMRAQDVAKLSLLKKLFQLFVKLKKENKKNFS